MKSKEDKLIKWIMDVCPYPWARDINHVSQFVKHLKDKPIKHFESGGFAFRKTKTGKWYLETKPMRKYVT